MKHQSAPFLTHLILLLAVLIFSAKGFAQYYYHDILLTIQNQQQQQLYKKNQVAQVTLTSYEANGRPTPDFSCEVIINNNYTQTRTSTRDPISGSSLLTTFFNIRGQLYHSVDSSTEVTNEYTYKFDSDNRLTEAHSLSQSASGGTRESEIHLWTYNPNGCPEHMLRIKNERDTTIVKFVCDENGNVTEEQNWQKQVAKEKIYYYYDSLNRLTDIVRYNKRADRLLPDYMFEYYPGGQLSQMTTVQQGGSDYLIWKYLYDENGLRKSAVCADRNKKIIGRIEYQYSNSISKG